VQTGPLIAAFLQSCGCDYFAKLTGAPITCAPLYQSGRRIYIYILSVTQLQPRVRKMLRLAGTPPYTFSIIDTPIVSPTDFWVAIVCATCIGMILRPSSEGGPHHASCNNVVKTSQAGCKICKSFSLWRKQHGPDEVGEEKTES
jgi:hypothetical protein